MSAEETLITSVEKIESFNRELDQIKDEVKDVYAELKSSGFDTKIVRKVIAIRAKDPDELTEEEMLIKTYMDAITAGRSNA